MKYVLSFWVSLFIILSVPVMAKEQGTFPPDLSSFALMAKIDTAVNIPTVVEVTIPDLNFRDGRFAVYEETTKTFQPTLYGEEKTVLPVSVTSDVVPSVGTVSSLTHEGEGFVEFPASQGDEKSAVSFDFSFPKAITTSGIFVDLETYVALPQTVSVSTVDSLGNTKIVLKKTNIQSKTIFFPKTTSDHLRISFEHTQLLRIRNISFSGEELSKLEGKYFRFLARPGERYTLYFESDQSETSSTLERANLADNHDIKTILGLTVMKNPLYVPSDKDDDSIADIQDNCVNIPNQDQSDENQNGRGDVCDDYDKDGIVNSKDNCPNHPNVNQRDEDSDGKGDVCDGVESRITESRPYLPWLAMALGMIVVSGLFFITLRRNQSSK